MAKRVAHLFDAYCAISKELEQLMPQQYRRETSDPLGQAWRQAVQSLATCDDYFCDLASLLEIKADSATERSAASIAVVPAKAEAV